jgi:hypothetical protein
MKRRIHITNSCEVERVFRVNCDSLFRKVRPLIGDVVSSKRFIKDLKDEAMITSVDKAILDCSQLDFDELHKFEKNIDGCLIFRTKEAKMHIVYGVDKKKTLIFLRAIRNFTQYKKILTNKARIKAMMNSKYSGS